ncbi:MAG TPA: NAD(P)(+) transhydrogenase (Re/Si-specific) subunit beta [Mycobacteriales bacterium]|jgi:NAD(P) transhydrogenase subunit beta|nr:NAD(P)(+) transhydrogenase (Re/Si-specific) subunit beta [Mycobacteriales bacterium]
MTRLETLELIYLACAVSFIVALKGLSSPKWARQGNLIGAAGMLVAIATTFAWPGLHKIWLIVVGIVVGTAVAVPAARMVKMTAIPQMVAAFNGVGGGAAALVSLADFNMSHSSAGIGTSAAVLFSVLIGGVSFTGSAVTFAKLQELMTGRPVVLPRQRLLNTVLAVASLVFVIWGLAAGSMVAAVLLCLAALVFGVLFVLPVGGADVPVVISLLNAFTGLAVAASGAVLRMPLLIIAGTLVGASGTLLTQLMATAMGRPLTNILFGAITAKPTTAMVEGSTDRSVRTGTVDDVAILLAYARRVVVVPGYGLAVAQAQHTVHELAKLLEERGVEVSYGIHPVAGRMPGHMNVLLAEANVPYEQLQEMDEVNGRMGQTDVVLVVGANDVVNPAARDQPGSPIYGMPIIDADRAQQIVFMKRSMRPGFAGIDNALLYDAKTTMLFGDAKDTLGALVTAVKAA